MADYGLTAPPKGFTFSPEYAEWLLCKRYDYDIMRLHSMYPDIPQFCFHPPIDKWNEIRLKDTKKYEEKTGFSAFVKE